MHQRPLGPCLEFDSAPSPGSALLVSARIWIVDARAVMELSMTSANAVSSVYPMSRRLSINIEARGGVLIFLMPNPSTEE